MALQEDSKPKPRPFSVQSVSSWGADVLYRVYIQSDLVYFIPVGKQGTDGTFSFGILSIATLFFMHRQTKAKEEAKRNATAADSQQPDELLQTREGSFKLEATQFADCRIEAPGAFRGLNDMHALRWFFRTPEGKKFEMRVEHVREAKSLLQSLESLLGEQLTVNVEWDTGYHKYKKRQKSRSS